MTKERIDEFNEMMFDYVRNILETEGAFPAQICISGDSLKETGKNMFIVIPINPEFLQSDEGKDLLVQRIFPALGADIRKICNIEIVVFLSEGWARKVSKDFNWQEQNFRDFPIKCEVLIVCIDTADGKMNRIMEIQRDGKRINKEGDIVDNVTLNDIAGLEDGTATLSGRFHGLYKVFTEG